MSKLWKMVKNTEAWQAAVHGVTKSLITDPFSCSLTTAPSAPLPTRLTSHVVRKLPVLIATGEAIPLRGLEGVPGLPGAPQDAPRGW